MKSGAPTAPRRAEAVPTSTIVIANRKTICAPARESVSPVVCPLECQAKYGYQQARERSRYTRQQRENQHGSAVLFPLGHVYEATLRPEVSAGAASGLHKSKLMP